MVRFFSFKEELPIMKIICEKDLLVEAVSNVARAACAKSPVPALEGHPCSRRRMVSCS